MRALAAATMPSAVPDGPEESTTNGPGAAKPQEI